MSSRTYKTSALRIQGCIGKFLSHRLFEQNAKLRKYDFVQPLRIPSQAKRLSLHGLRLNRKKSPPKKHTITKDPSSQTLRLSLQPTQCSVNQKYAQSLTKEKDLSSKRIISWQIKGHFLVCEALKRLARKTNPSLSHHNIVSMEEPPTENPHNPYLNELHQTQEERLFQIDRVIKHLG